MATTTKTTATKKANTAKPAVKKEIKEEIIVNEETAKEEKVEVKKEPKVVTFDGEDLILCRSISPGETVIIGKKSDNRYIWSGIGDVHEVEVRDLDSLRASKHPLLYRPLVIIENDDFMAQPKWKELKEMYDEMLGQDFDEMLDLPLAQFRAALLQIKQGYRKALTIKITDMIEEGTFDSMNKIKAVDEIFGTDLAIMIK